MNSYENWLGQTLYPGDIVFNGQRDGNMSTFRLGRIKALKWNGAKDKVLAQVEWVAERTYRGDEAKTLSGRWDTTASTLSADNLVVVDPSILQTIKYRTED